MLKKITAYFIFNLINLYCLSQINIDNVILTKYIIVCLISFYFFLYVDYKIKNSFASFFVLIYIFGSHSIIFFVPGIIDSMSYYEQFNQFNFSLSLSIVFFVAFFIYNSIIRIKARLEFDINNLKSQKPFKRFHVFMFFTLLFILSSTSFYLGLSRMGSDAVILPYNIGGIINYIRIQIAPMILAIVFYKNYYNGNKRYLIMYFLIALVWVVLESFVRLSRGVLLEAFLPVILVLLLSSIISFKKIFIGIVVFIIIAYTAFPILTSLRSTEKEITLEEIQETATSINNEEFDTFTKVFRRTFSNGRNYVKIMPYIGENFIDFQNFSKVFQVRGSHFFTTYYIDNLWDVSNTNSGTTGICDSLLIGGKGFALFSFLLSVLFAFYIDSDNLRQKPLIRIFFFNILRWLVQLRFWSLFIDIGEYSMLVVWLGILIIIKISINKNNLSQEIVIA